MLNILSSFARKTALVTFCALIASTTAWSLTGIKVNDLGPNRQQAITALMVVKRLEQLHYNHQRLDDTLSATILDRYLNDLDPAHSYFLASDIKEFEKYRFEMDDALVNGNLSPAFAIFNRYQHRMVDRLAYLDVLLNREFDQWQYTTNDTVEADRKQAPWPANQSEWDDLWRKRLMYTALNMKLTGKSPAKIKKTLERRYKSQLTRALQVNSDDAFQIFLNSVTQTYDPHTQYLSQKVSENFNINMSLQLEGIGAVLQAEDEYTKIQSLVTGGPADRSKLLHPADRIVGVAQEGDKDVVDVVGWRLDEVVERIRGKKGTKVTLQIIPAGSSNEHETKLVTITRDQVKLEDRAAQSTIIETKHDGKAYKIGVINVPAFYLDFQCTQHDEANCRSTTRDVAALINKLKKQNIDGLIIDLRNNGGGALQEANSLVGLFIERGPTVQIRSSGGKIDTMLDTDPRVAYTGPLAVVVNRLSASASEIFAGAIQDYRRGVIVGERTFGKGTVQSMQQLDQGQLKITLAKFYRISGDTNQNKGVSPDIAMPSLLDHEELGESALFNALPADTIRPAHYDKDRGLEAAIPLLRENAEQRIRANPDFMYLNEQVKLLDEARAAKTVSLNEKTREAEQTKLDSQRLKLENDRRKGKHETPFKTVADMKKAAEKDEADALTDHGAIKVDFVLDEASNIVSDVISSTASMNSRVASH
ncbi:Periplasmic tail-specific protease [gamma proteobacterium HdN1]|nr:Periplasmic tail-specific protease [gamma proteobacterium HdN1]